jgi:hypothetical protein
MSVQMRNRVAQREVVQLHWREDCLDGATDLHHVLPVAGGPVRLQVGRFGHVFVTPDHDAVAGYPGPALEVHLGKASLDDDQPEMVVSVT